MNVNSLRQTDLNQLSFTAEHGRSLESGVKPILHRHILVTVFNQSVFVSQMRIQNMK